MIVPIIDFVIPKNLNAPIGENDIYIVITLPSYEEDEGQNSSFAKVTIYEIEKVNSAELQNLKMNLLQSGKNDASNKKTILI
jgi:hypothetical protein